MRADRGNPGIVPEWYELPTFYFSNPHAVVGPGEPVAIPAGCSRLDYELEVGIIIGTPGSNIRPEDGLSHVFGLTILNDWSARDIQGREMKVGLGPAKGKDFANTIGPVLVTMDEFAGRIDADGFLDLGMAVAVNGVETGRDLLSNMGWPIGDLVAYASRETWVHPGDLLGSGTCGNGGCLAELWGRSGGLDPRPLVAGDVVTMWVEGIGRISTSVVEGRDVPGPVRVQLVGDHRQRRPGRSVRVRDAGAGPQERLHPDLRHHPARPESPVPEAADRGHAGRGNAARRHHRAGRDRPASAERRRGAC